jgi:hypothetical protein
MEGLSMKKAYIFTVLGCLVLLLVGCVPSLHPFYTDKDLVYEPKLEGRWLGNEGKDTYIFKHSGEKEYTLTMYSEDSIPADFDAHLFKLGKFLYLDIYPQNLQIKNDFLAMHAIKTHTLSKLKINTDTIDISMIDPDNVKNLRDKKKLKVKHETSDGDIMFTASTGELQEFIKKYSKELFSKPQTLPRKK